MRKVQFFLYLNSHSQVPNYSYTLNQPLRPQKYSYFTILSNSWSRICHSTPQQHPAHQLNIAIIRQKKHNAFDGHLTESCEYIDRPNPNKLSNSNTSEDLRLTNLETDSIIDLRSSEGATRSHDLNNSYNTYASGKPNFHSESHKNHISNHKAL